MDESYNNIKEYFMELQKKLQDFRDNRGKRHDLAFVVLSFFISILRSSSKLNYSLIHRNMQRDNEFLIKIVNKQEKPTISYSQLKRILSQIDYESFNSISQNYFDKQIVNEGLFWQAIDGKELRGTIDKVVGEKRSENIIQRVSHQTKQSQLIGFYNGIKESEKTLVKNYIETQSNLIGQGYSFDALHTSSELLKKIAEKDGIYLAQVKENQKYLLEECKHIHQHLQPKEQYSTLDKGHGRIENRIGFLYPLNVECLEERWKDSNIQTVLIIERSRRVVKTNVETKETVCFVSNKSLAEKSGAELFKAARQHWAIESDNYIRDVNFGEDEIICFDKKTSRMMAVSISLAINLLRRKNKNNNIRALREAFNTDRNIMASCFAVN